MKRRLISIVLALSFVLCLLPLSAKAMALYAVVQGNTRIALEVESGDSTENVKQKISEKTGVLPEEQILEFNGRFLEDGRTLADYNVQKNSEISLYFNTGDVFYISSADQLLDFASKVNSGETYASGTKKWRYATFVQIADIDLADRRWTPLNDSFKGTYDGGGFAIKNLKISGQYGFFSYLSFATVKNLNFENVKLDGSGVNTGIIASQAGKGGEIINCSVKNAEILSLGNCTGGIAGFIAEDALIERCSFDGMITATGNAGGIAGRISGTVRSSYSSGHISAGLYSGGIAYSNSGIIENCYSLASVGGNLTGGIAGENNGLIKNSVALNKEVSAGESAGAVAGESQNDGKEINCYAREDLLSDGNFTRIYCTAGELSVQMREIFGDDKNFKFAPDRLPGFDGSLPLPEWVSHMTASAPVSESPDIDFSNSTVYISSAKQLRQLAKQLNEWEANVQYDKIEGYNFVQTADIDLAGEDWTPIKILASPYDGGGFSIKNMRIRENEYGSFAVDARADIKNVRIVDCDIEAPAASGIALMFTGSTMDNCFVSGSISGSVTEMSSIGGLICGTLQGTDGAVPRITNCTSAVRMKGILCGGITTVINNSAIVKNCYFTGSIQAYNAGGIACETYTPKGTEGTAIISDCYVAADISLLEDSNMYPEDFSRGGAVIDTIGSNTQINNCTVFDSFVDAKGTSDGVFGRIDGEPAVEIKGCYVFGGMKVNGENVNRSDNFNFLFAADGKMYTDSEYTLPFEIKTNSLWQDTDSAYLLPTLKGTPRRAMPLEMQSLRRVNVTFSCGDVNNTFKVISGTGPVAPAAPEKENYEFAGWFNGEIAFDSFKTAYKDITFTARYKDTVLPEIHGIENGKVYCKEAGFTVSDNEGISSVTVDGEEIQPDNSGKYTLSSKEAEQTVVARDLAGNECRVTVKVNADHAGDGATCVKKAVCTVCGEEFGETDGNRHLNLTHVERKEPTEDSEGNIEYWRCEDCGKCFADKDGKNEVTDTVLPKINKPGNLGDRVLTASSALAALAACALLYISKAKRQF